MMMTPELNALYSEKKSIAEEFHRAYVLYQQYRRERRKERRQKQQAQIQARHQKCQYEDVAIPEPYEKERGFCKTLLSYLGKFDVNASGSASGSLLLCPNDAHPPLRLSVSQDSGFQLLKGRKADTEEDVKYSPVVVKARKKSRQERRVSIKNRPLSHTPEALQLFDQLGVSPPTLVSDVSAAVEQISSLLHDYQKLTESEKPMMPNGDCGTVQEMHEANGMKSKNGQSGDIQELCPVFMSYKSPEKRQNQSSCHEAIDSDKILANYVTQTSGRTVHCHQSQQPDMIPVPLTDTKTAMFQAPDEEPMMGISLMSLSIISQVDGLEPQTGSVSAISRTNDKQQMTESMTNFPVIQQNQLVASGGAVSQAGDEVSKHVYPQKVSLISSNCTKTSFSYFKTSGPSPYFDPCNVPVEVLEDFLGEPILNIINNQSHAEDAVCTDAASVEVLKKYIVPLPYVMDLMSGSDSVYDSEAVGSLISGRLVMSASCPQLNGEMASDFDTYLSSPLLMSRQTEPIVKEALLSSSGTHSA
ncbi:unnamed protein product [Darwinula stevensoni]|uniref:Uncharacterized protein n=1 Tax=Darwinula stevensoni TaxID=69355 RepID=A0A7R9A6S4_9CRUS|nr:unnamed protein product [Darwinula stevensoni]CAG0888794.1 unnamed protein product [Darwinula stevensoni]